MLFNKLRHGALGKLLLAPPPLAIVEGSIYNRAPFCKIQSLINKYFRGF